jgi:hypothetical protein
MAHLLHLAPIVIDRRALSESESRDPFDQFAEEMLARGGSIAEQVIASVQRATPPEGLDLDQAVVGGLLVRVAKLIRGVFDATQADESEAHLALSRCAAETAITLVWLVRHGDESSLRRFRADSFAYWRGQLERMAAADGVEDDDARSLRERVELQVERELVAAGVSWDEVPRRSSNWGPNIRQQCEQLDVAWMYTTLFASHSSYVHPSWHELRAFHLMTDGGAVSLDLTFGGMAPIVGYLLGRLAAEASEAAIESLPCDLNGSDVRDRVRATVEASRILSADFATFMARGGADQDLHRHASDT